MKKRLLWTIMGLVLVVALVASACAAPAPTPTPTPTPKPTPTPTPAPKVKPVIIRMADHSPATGIRADGLNFFKEELEKRTDGRVEFEIYFSDTLVSEPECVAAVEKGTADATSVSPGKHVSELPYWEVFGALTAFPGPIGQIDLFWKILDEIPEFTEDYNKVNQTIWGFHHLPSLALFLVKPANSIWDVKGRTIRVYCPPHASLIEALDAFPVYLPMAECYMAMERGTIDGVLTPFESGIRFRFHEVATQVNYLDSIWAGTTNVMTINNDSLNKLSAADQKVFMDCGREMTAFISELLVSQMDGMFAGIGELGHELVKVPQADQEKLTSNPMVKALPDEWAGKLNASHIVDKLRELAAEAIK